jgi:anti-sigma B factor antagonist
VAETIAVHGEIDISSAPDLGRRLDALIDDHPGDLIEVDFASVTFVDSSGLGALLAAQRRARAAAGDLWVSNLQPNLRTVFQLTGLDKILLVPA